MSIHFPTFKKLFRWSAVRFLVFALAALVTVAFLFFAIENWRGHRAWQTARQNLENRGEPLDYWTFIPPPVSPEENFAATPLLASLFVYEWVPEKNQWEWKGKIPELGLERPPNSSARARSKRPQGSRADWLQGESIDLEAWAEYFRAGPDWFVDDPPAEASSAQVVLQALQVYQPALDELREAARRPYSRFDLRYEDLEHTILPHLALLRSAGRILELKAVALLAEGRTKEAFENTQLLLALARALELESFTISNLVEQAVLRSAVNVLREGMSRSAWSAAQLLEFEEALAQFNLLADYQRSLRAERAFGLAILERLRTTRRITFGGNEVADPQFMVALLPAGWFYQNKARFAHAYDPWIASVHPELRRIAPALPASHGRTPFGDAGNGSPTGPDGPRGLSGPFLYRWMASMLVLDAGDLLGRFARTQTLLDLARTVCALDRHRLEVGEFPESLEALVPGMLPAIPEDLMSGRPLRYRRLDEAGFLLYSIGWNRQDDGGDPRGWDRSSDTGDWVWPHDPIQ